MVEGAVDCVMLGQTISTVFGWHVRSPGDAEDPNRAIDAEFSHAGQRRRDVAPGACLATERGIEVCAPVHDAFLICAPIDRIEADVAAMRAAMDEAARAVLDGFPIPTEAKIVRYPDRYMDKRGIVMWERVIRLVVQCQKAREVA